MRLAKVLGILVAYLLMTGDVCAQTPTTEDCQGCHAEPSMTRADGRPVVVEPKAFEQSAHSVLGCVDCHTDLSAVTEFPHQERLAPVDCAICHDEPVSGFQRSIHGADGAAATGRVGCASCHGPPHAIRSSSDPESSTNVERLVATCGQCHSDTAAAGQPRGPAVAGMFADSIHGRALTRTTVAPTCSNCHGSHDIRLKTDPEALVHPPNVAATCGACHASQRRLYDQSVHAELLAGGTSQAPHCASCHTAHSIGSTLEDRWQLSAVEECGTCHREALVTYRDTFHGQVTELGFTPVAKCADCHQSHRVLRVSDPASPVAPPNRLATCQTCHPSATENFARYQPHANKDDPERSPVLYYAASLMDGLLIGVFAFFGLHTLLWFVRERMGPREDPDITDE